MPNQVKDEARAVGEKLSIEEIERRYPNEWVVLVDTERTNMTTRAGVVYAHSPRRADARAAARGLPAVAIFWTGEIQSPTLWALSHVHRPI